MQTVSQHKHAHTHTHNKASVRIATLLLITVNSASVKRCFSTLFIFMKIRHI